MVTEAYLLFTLERGRYALKLATIDGVDPVRAIRPVPGAPRLILGVSAWRDRLLTVLDLAGAIGEGPSADPPCLLRLSAPHVGLAFHLPAATSIGHPRQPDPCGTSIVWDGRSHSLLSPDVLVESVLAVEA